MPAKSPTEQIRDLERDLIAFKEKLSHSERSIDAIGTVNNEINKELLQLRKDYAEVRQELALVRQRLEDHLKRVELWDARRWGLISSIGLAFLGAVLSFVAGVILVSVRK